MRYLNWPVFIEEIEVGNPVAFDSGTIAWVIDKKTVSDSDTLSSTKVKVRDRSNNEESPWLGGTTYVFDLESLLASHEFSYIE